MKKLPQWHQGYIAKVAGMSNRDLFEEMVSQSRSAAEFGVPGSTANRLREAAVAELKKRLEFCGFLVAGEK